MARNNNDRNNTRGEQSFQNMPEDKRKAAARKGGERSRRNG